MIAFFQSIFIFFLSCFKMCWKLNWNMCIQLHRIVCMCSVYGTVNCEMFSDRRLIARVCYHTTLRIIPPLQRLIFVHRFQFDLFSCTHHYTLAIASSCNDTYSLWNWMHSMHLVSVWRCTFSGPSSVYRYMSPTWMQPLTFYSSIWRYVWVCFIVALQASTFLHTFLTVTSNRHWQFYRQWHL